MAGPSIDNDEFFFELPPLPAGWDWARCKRADSDLAAVSGLSSEDQSLVSAYRDARIAQWREKCGAEDAAFHRRQRHVREMMSTDDPETHRRLVHALAMAILPSPPAGTPAAARVWHTDADDDVILPDEVPVIERYVLPRWQVGTPLFEIADVMYRQDCQYWGFTVFQVWGYDSAADQARLEQFMRRWQVMVQDTLIEMVMAGIKNTGLGEGHEGFEEHFKEMYEPAIRGGIVAKWQCILQSHEALSSADSQFVRASFRAMLKLDEEEDEDMPNRAPTGIDAGLCLMVDEGVVNSLLDEGRRPYIIGVQSDYDDEEITDEHEASHFKIALESVVDLWRQTQVQRVYELMPPEGKIYVSPGVFENDG
ncbi:hypothetical protein B0H63DRAFT_472404 [Podospora didyma]|uniref:Uncharacterized protein n=1 Tax=Podospora didyma TaxID=330526 RepID=A0AAE0NP46_9PEZI|nr:hypothetical protein B0H63DRAFT_472404 [Podospora didyma]